MSHVRVADDEHAAARVELLDGPDHGRPSLKTRPDDSASADLARTDAIADTVDLDALDHDVRAWLAAVDELDAQAEEIVEAIETLR